LFFLNLAIFFLHQHEMDVDREAMHMGIQAPDDFNVLDECLFFRSRVRVMKEKMQMEIRRVRTVVVWWTHRQRKLKLAMPATAAGAPMRVGYLF
jgi:hypothetical protein